MSRHRRAKVGTIYSYHPVLWDKVDAHTRHIKEGLFVRVINLRGAPTANTMGHCHIEGAVSGEFLGLVFTNSLQPLTAAQRRTLKKQGTIPCSP